MAKTLEERIDHYKAIAEKHGYVLLEECLIGDDNDEGDGMNG